MGRVSETNCPCCSGEIYDACCGPILAGDKPAATATRLMRSRYTAFAVGDRDHLVRSWHPQMRPKKLTLDPDEEWFRLEVLAASKGSMFDTEGTVEFRAHYRLDGERDTVHENSRFVRHEGRWVYWGPSAS